MSSTESLQGREVVLAGGTGGLGIAVAEALLTEGARLIVSYCQHSDRALRWEGRASVLRADLATACDRKSLLDAAAQLYAVVVFSGDPARITDPGQVESAMERSHRVNYLGPILFAREAVERMRANGSAGAVVLVSTMQANALFPGSSVYAAQKVALQHAGRILAKECRGAPNIRVNIVSPGVMAAGMALSSIQAGKYERFLKEGVIPRYGRAEDVARVVRFLLEPDNYITGQVLCVDGGMTL